MKNLALLLLILLTCAQLSGMEDKANYSDIESLPVDIKLIILKKLAQVDNPMILDQSMIDSLSAITALSHTNKHFHNFINSQATINELYKNSESDALALGIPGAIEWIKNHEKLQVKKDDITFFWYLKAYLKKSPKPFLRNTFAKAYISGLVKCDCIFSIEFNRDGYSARCIQELIACIGLSEKDPWLLWVLTHAIDGDAIIVAVMLEEAIKCKNQAAVYWLLQNPKLEINQGLGTLPSTNQTGLFSPSYAYYFSDTIKTPLMKAISCGHNGIVYLLLTHPKVDIKKEVDGKTALDSAQEVGNKEVALMLEYEMKKIQ